MKLKLFYVFLLNVLVSAGSHAQQANPKERMFLPSDTFYGYAQFDLAPPHNEIDPNLCRSDAGSFGGANAPCNALGCRQFRRGQCPL